MAITRWLCSNLQEASHASSFVKLPSSHCSFFAGPAFRTTFYFTTKTDQGIERLPIAQELKTACRATSSSGKLKPLTIEVRSKKALADVLTIFGCKSGA